MNYFTIRISKSMRMLVNSILVTLFFMLVSLSCFHGVASADTTVGIPTAVFSNRYAVIGDKLTITLDGVVIEDNSRYCINWYVDGKLIDNEESYYVPVKDDICKMLKAEICLDEAVIADCSILIDNLPVMYIDTENEAPIESKVEYINAEMKLQGNEKYNLAAQLYSGDIQIRGRGNSTWKLNKKPYKIKLGSKSGLLGMPKSKHWVLIANYFDESLMRNKLAYDLSGQLGMPYMKSSWVDVVMNGEYVGNYQLCEQVRVDSNRVDIYDWEEAASELAKGITKINGLTSVERDDLETALQTDYKWVTDGKLTYKDKEYSVADYTSLPNITGGYLIEVDLYYDEVSRFRTEQKKRVCIAAPEYLKTNDSMFKYVQNYIQTFENACSSSNFLTDYNGRQVHYSDLADMKSLIDYWIVQDLVFANCEFETKSTYMYKDIDGLLYFGPVWDMDYSAFSFQNQAAVSKLFGNDIANVSNEYAPKWYPRLLGDPYFVVKAQERIEEIMPKYVLPMYMDKGLISQYNYYLFDSGLVNTAVWKYRRGYSNDIAALTKWFVERSEWIKDNFTCNNKSLMTLGVYSQDENINVNVTYARNDASILNGELINLNPDDEHVSYRKLDDGDLKGYYYEGDSFYVNVYDKSADDKIIELYVNGDKVNEASDNDGLIQFQVSRDVMTEDMGTQNVFVVRARNAEGVYTGSNYITVTDRSEYEEPVPTFTPAPPAETLIPSYTPEPSEMPGYTAVPSETPSATPLVTKSPVVPSSAPTGYPSPAPEEPTVSPVVSVKTPVPQHTASESPQPVGPTDSSTATPIVTLIPIVTPTPTIGKTNTYLITDTKTDIRYGSLKYRMISADKKTVKVTGVIKKGVKSISIPSSILFNGDKYKVTSIAPSAFKNCSKLKNVVVGNNVTSIGAKAFQNCKKLRRVKIKSIKVIGIIKSAFNNTSDCTFLRVPKGRLDEYKKKYPALADRMK